MLILREIPFMLMLGMHKIESLFDYIAKYILDWFDKVIFPCC